MLEAERYREYAQDCLRMAEKAAQKDKETLRQMAEAWMRCAEERRKSSAVS